MLTLIDFSRPSQHKRLWVINVEKGKVLFHTLVAHGKASGADVPMAFSNKDGSEMSSLGFYRTAPTTYTGKHGLSLKLVGLDPGFNTNAESRAVVVHGADYVCEDFVKAHGRLGRSQGCPALPVAETHGHCAGHQGRQRAVSARAGGCGLPLAVAEHGHGRGGISPTRSAARSASRQLAITRTAKGALKAHRAVAR